jgi:protein associated with RNAse G/E
MELNIQKTKIVSLTRKASNIHFNCRVSHVFILRSDFIKYYDLILDSKLHSHCHVDFVYSQTLRTLIVILHVTSLL